MVKFRCAIAPSTVSRAIAWIADLFCRVGGRVGSRVRIRPFVDSFATRLVDDANPNLPKLGRSFWVIS